jgi:hypothetical protein
MKLKIFQERVTAGIMQPLTRSGGIARRTREGAPMAREALELIKPNSKLTSLERLEIYSRSYWFRLIDCMRDDFPGVLFILGSARFDRLVTAYLVDCPSRSFTLRDLGSQLETWLRDNPKFADLKFDLVLDMVQLEWAHIVAFDGPAETPIEPQDLIELTPGFRVRLQPCITILDLQYPVDELRVQINAAPEGYTSTSNFTLSNKRVLARSSRKFSGQSFFVAVHRLELNVYYRRLSPEEFRILKALSEGKSIAVAIRLAFREGGVQPDEIPELLRTWFSTWARLGWLSIHTPGRKK